MPLQVGSLPRALGCVFADRLDYFPTLLVSALELTSCWEGPGPGEKMAASRRGPAK